jgi:hypothetical protein
MGQASGVGATSSPGARTVRQFLAGAYLCRFYPALQVHTPLQLLSARVPVQTLTEHWLKLEGRKVRPRS